ncbi:MAG: hypothetical protein HQ561_04235, partial [Desulfobacteraceae bacterium]|nr:hypothetical protein [Desulfobacteraceae bacterium]
GVLYVDRPVESELVADELDLLRRRHLTGEHLGRISREHPQHKEQQKGNADQDRDG